MQTVSQTFLNVLLRMTTRSAGADDISPVIEIYDPATLPGDLGFDPADALLCLASVSGITFRGRTYARYVTTFDDVTRTLGPSFNSFTFSLDNSDRAIAAFVLSQPLGIEGFHVVYRYLSRSESVNLDDSMALFTGRLEKPVNFDRSTNEAQFSAKQHLGTVDQEFPRRKYGATDLEGRAPDDVLFEGFIFRPQNISVTFQEKERRSGLLGLFGFSHKVTRTLAYSSYSNLDANTVVPEMLGRSQITGQVLAAVDAGALIFAIYGWTEGPIEGYANHRTLSSQLINTNVFSRFGELGNTGDPGREQVPIGGGGAANYPGNTYYSRTSWTAEVFSGTEIGTQDEAPDVANTIIGRRVPLPDGSGDFLPTNGDDFDFKFTDNPIYLVRWLLTVKHGFNLPAEFIDDAATLASAAYCNHYLEDRANTDRVFISENAIADAGTAFVRYKSTGALTPQYFRNQFLADDTVNPWLVEPDYEPFDPSGALPDFTPTTLLRRRYTTNVPITDTTKVIDVLFKILATSARLYLVQGANSKIQIRVKRPADTTIVREANALGDTAISVQSVLAWIDDTSGQVCVGAQLITAEVRRVTGYAFAVEGNDVTLAVSGDLTRSAATLAGCDGAHVPATGTVTVTSTAGGTITIDGVAVSYAGSGADTTGTVAAMLAAAVLANPTLNQYVKASWDPVAPTIVSLSAKLGTLALDVALDKTHNELEEVVRVQLSLADSANRQANCERANMLTGSFNFPLGTKQSPVNQVKGTYRDASQDYRLTPMIVNDYPHQVQTNKVSPLDVDLSACDNHHQAVRILNGVLAEVRDGDFFTQQGVTGEGLLLEEGDVIAVTDSSGGFVNLLVRIEDVQVKSDKTAVLTARRYLTSQFDDTVIQKTIPLPTTLSIGGAPSPVNISIIYDGFRAYVTWKGVSGVEYQLATDTTGYTSSFLFDGPGGAASFIVPAGVTVVYLRGTRTNVPSPWATINIPGVGGDPTRPAPYNVASTGTTTTTASFSWIRNAVDNTDVEYTIDGGSTWTATGSATATTFTVTGRSPGDVLDFAVRNKWATGTPSSESSEVVRVTLPMAGGTSFDPTNLRVTSIAVNSHNVGVVNLAWNNNDGTDPTFHLSNESLGMTTTYHPTSGAASQHFTIAGGSSFSAYVTTAEGSNPSNTVQELVDEY
jgi:hypothetical protein